MGGRTRVYVEVGGKRTFASAADWPGWCRSGKDEATAMVNLAAYAPRYARVSKLARIELPKDVTNFTVVERMTGNATTDFGAPAIPAKSESKEMSRQEAERMRALVDACWKYLNQVRATAPNELRKGPRGGGRDRDKIFDHVLDAETAYAQAIGIRLKHPGGKNERGVKAFREALMDGFREPNRQEKWPVPYAARRTAWHALDHAWEIEDRLT